MPRRLAALSALVLALVLAAGTLAIASGGKGSSSTTTTAPAAATSPAPARTGTATGAGFGLGAGRGHGGAMMKMVRKVVLDSLAARLQVTPAALKTGVHAVAVDQFAKAAKQAGLTTAQTDALKACHTARVTARKTAKAARTRGAAARKAARKTRRQTRAAACDRSVIRPAIKKLKALPEPDLAAKKTELADALAAELGTTGAKVVEAFRAELEQRLGQAVGFGVLTEAGKTKALACFDTPATCDEAGLRKELRGPLKAMAAGHHRGHHRR
jgi:hypothetical protein